MAVDKKPVSKVFDGKGKIWSQKFSLFNAKVFVPYSDLPGDIINFGFSAPYFIKFTDRELSDDEAVKFADENGLTETASSYETSVVFINPLNEDGWKSAPEGIFEELIANSKIHQYHEDGIAILNNRFFHTNDGFAIRGAIFRTCLFADGDSADYIASHLLKTVNGEGLWGPADVAPTVCVLENLSVIPHFERRDMPVVSIANSPEINKAILDGTDYSLILEKRDLRKAFHDFICKFKRWGWTGDLQEECDFEKLGMIEQPCIAELKTSEDNEGDDRETEKHKVGFIAYYNKDLFKKGPAPLVLCFHGGGDSAKHIAQVSQWYKVSHDHDFLLVCVENHINSTASEMMELLEILKEKYSIDEQCIYGTGFSMGGCKTWDLFQEYPEVFAALAPMDATFDMGLNLYGKPSRGYHGTGKINENVSVPVFYAGGEVTPLPELPFQAEKCLDRMRYVLKVNRCTSEYDVRFEDRENWKDKIWGIGGDRIQKIKDESRSAILTLNYFESESKKIITVFGSVDNQGHECRYHTCEYAWRFMSRFRRLKDGTIEGDCNDLL